MPDRIEPKYITGAYVSCQQSLEGLNAVGGTLPISGNRHLFFYLGNRMVKTLIADMFDSSAQTLVNTVNCVGSWERHCA